MSIPSPLPVEFPTLKKRGIQTLQVNMGRFCNQSCTHCHVGAGPERTETMPTEVVEDVLRFLRNNPMEVLDITGGAPELHPLFATFLAQARPLVSRLIVRSNITVLQEPGMEDLPHIYEKNHVELMCSLPCYTEENVNRQRGPGAFKKSILGLTLLNAIGYGKEETDLLLNLVYNPGGGYLPGDQSTMETDYKRELWEQFGITFNQLFCMANMPIARFERFLKRGNSYENYISLLEKNFNASTLPNLMCLGQLSIRWDGFVFDCDFNQMLDLKQPEKKSPYISDIVAKEMVGAPVAVGQHCFGCTAGSGSSCSGALA